MTLARGTKLGPYKILERFGAGGERWLHHLLKRGVLSK